MRLHGRRNIHRFTVTIILLSVITLPATGLPKIDFGMRVLGGDIALRWPIPRLDPRAPIEIITSIYGGREEKTRYSIAGGDGSLDLNRYYETNIGGDAGIAYRIPITAHLLQFQGLIDHHSAWYAPYQSADGTESDEHVTGILVTGMFDRTSAIPVPFTRIPLDYRVDISTFWAPELAAINSAEYLRMNGVFRVSVQPVNSRIVQVFGSARIGIDALFGESIPQYAMDSVGELRQPYFHPCHDAIRGMGYGLFTGRYKTYATIDIEVRFITPLNINPGVILFVDTGFAEAENFASLLTSENHATAGISAVVNIMDVTEIGYFVAINPAQIGTDLAIGHGFVLSARIRS